MKYRTTQFAPRQNPDSPRVHGSRPALNSSSFRIDTQTQNSVEGKTSPLASAASGESNLSLAISTNGATRGDTLEEGQLLTVQEVAALLNVPVTWVYGRTRKRSSERLPSYRLGKYWRFREHEILEWVAQHRGGHHAA